MPFLLSRREAGEKREDGGPEVEDSASLPRLSFLVQVPPPALSPHDGSNSTFQEGRAGERGKKEKTHQEVHRPQRRREEQRPAQVGRFHARGPGAARQDGGGFAQDGGQVDAEFYAERKGREKVERRAGERARRLSRSFGVSSSFLTFQQRRLVVKVGPTTAADGGWGWGAVAAVRGGRRRRRREVRRAPRQWPAVAAARGAAIRCFDPLRLRRRGCSVQGVFRHAWARARACACVRVRANERENGVKARLRFRLTLGFRSPAPRDPTLPPRAHPVHPVDAQADPPRPLPVNWSVSARTRACSLLPSSSCSNPPLLFHALPTRPAPTRRVCGVR